MQDNNLDIDNYVFEWNKTLAKKLRNALMAESNFMYDAVELRLSVNMPFVPYTDSREIKEICAGDLNSSKARSRSS
jgi:hypothetical protein